MTGPAPAPTPPVARNPRVELDHATPGAFRDTPDGATIALSSDMPAIAVISEPTSLVLLGAGLLAITLGGYLRRRRRTAPPKR